MNILGFISAVLILISIAFQGYYFNWFADCKLQDNLKGYHKAYRDLKKECVNNQYDLIKEKKTPRKTNISIDQADTLKKKNKKNINYKKELTPYCMRFNLWPLRSLNTEKKETLVFLEKLITNLYQDKLICNKDIPPFVKKFAAAIQEKKTDLIYLEQLKFQNAIDQEIYYQMLKGKENCYPSFLNYVTINEDNNPRICLACADYFMLASLFNEKIAKELSQKKQTPLEQLIIDKKTLHTIVLTYGKIPEDLPKISLKHKKSNLKEITISAQEENTQIKLDQKIKSSFKLSS